MKNIAFVAAIIGLLIIGLTIVMPLQAQEQISHGRFKDVTLYKPKGDTKSFVLFLSGDGGWNQEVVNMAQALADTGAMVAGISEPQLIASLEKDSGNCVFPDGDLENLSHYLQGYAMLSTYHTPLLVGYSSGATLAYAMIAQAPSGTFSGAISLGFCTHLEIKKPLCKGEDVHFTQRKDRSGVDLLPTKKLRVPWVALHGAQDQVCDLTAAQKFTAQVPDSTLVVLPKVAHAYSDTKNWLPQYLKAFHSVSSAQKVSTPPPDSLANLPLVEVPTTVAGGDAFAVLLSGDGGWAGLDKDVAAALAAKGIPVVGWDSLRYFWSARTPQSLATDLDRVLRYYAARWNKPNAILIGYSQGADVLPFAINRLSATTKSLVKQTVMMGLGETASFEFHLGNWVGDDDSGLPILPEANKLNASSALCLYGEDEAKNSLCTKISAAHVTAIPVNGGHHFNGNYDKLTEIILSRYKSLY
jgi:type IV secretory pathway VirJ component